MAAESPRADNADQRLAFTPGPWGADGDDLAVVFANPPIGGYREIGFVWDSADRHLIAAAPELYEALEYLVADVKRAIPLLPQLARLLQDSGTFAHDIEDAEVALAKARGDE